MRKENFKYLEFKPSKNTFEYYDKKTGKSYNIPADKITPLTVIDTAWFIKSQEKNIDGTQAYFIVTSEYYKRFKNDAIIRFYKDGKLKKIERIDDFEQMLSEQLKVYLTIYGIYKDKYVALIIPRYKIRNTQIKSGDIISITGVMNEMGGDDLKVIYFIPQIILIGNTEIDQNILNEFDDSVKDYLVKIKKDYEKSKIAD